MRIHTNTIVHRDLLDAARGLPVQVTATEHGSRTHARAFEILLTGTSNRLTNSGKYGAGEDYAATWDEWGMFLFRLFDRDPFMRVGGIKAPVYKNADDFDRRTGGRYATLTPEEQHKNHRWGRSEDAGRHVCKCGAYLVRRCERATA